MSRLVHRVRRLADRLAAAGAPLRQAGKLNRLRFAGPGGPELVRAIRYARNPRSRLELVLSEIERRRGVLLQCSDPLVDGTLGAAGSWDAMKTVGAVCRASKRAPHCMLLYALTRELKPATVIELGTNIGISSAYLAAGLRLNGGGSLTTLEASPYRLRVARELHSALGLPNIAYEQGLFAETLPAVLKTLPPVDMAFIDGDHKYQPTLDYFEAVLAHGAELCVFVFDDIRWSEEMKQAWQVLAADRRFRIVADLDRMGVCIAGRERGAEPVRIDVRLPTAW